MCSDAVRLLNPLCRAVRSLPFLFVLAGLVACSGGTDEPAEDREEAASTAALADPLPAQDRVFAIEGLSGPEAVKYDPDQDHYIISNWGEEREGGVNDGFLSLASAEDGEIVELRWAVGSEQRPLEDPRGMTLQGDTLWVADAQGLHAFGRESGDHLAFVDLTDPEPGFLNDIVTGPDGAIYVTDTGASRLLRVAGGEGEVVLEGEALGSPNGITWDASRGALVLVPWTAGGDSLRAYDPSSGELRITARSPGGRFDGVEVAGEALIVASQADSALHVVEGEEGWPWQKVPGAPADIGYDTRRDQVAVPYIALDRVDVYAGYSGGTD